MACGGGSQQALPTVVVVTPTPSPITTELPLESPSPPALAVARVDFSCRLPAYSPTAAGVDDLLVDFPKAVVTAAGQGGHYYDRAADRWLPVFSHAVSPDGLRYAYTEGWSVEPATRPNVHIVDAASGADLRVAPMPDAQPYTVVDFTAAGVFLMIRFEGTTPGVWKLDPNSGVVTKVSNGLYRRSGAGWLGIMDGRDRNPYRNAIDGAVQPNRIDWREADGRMTAWVYMPGHALAWIGFAGPRALLVMSRSTETGMRTDLVQYWLITAPGQAVELSRYEGGDPTPWEDAAEGFFQEPVADLHGIWIGSATSLYLVTPDGRLMRVLGRSAYPAGTCL